MKPFYALRRNSNDLILLTPFLDRREVVSWEDEDIIVQLSGSCEPSIEETIQYRLYSAIDAAVDAWIQELKYIPRLINSALAFLVSYFFFSFVVRDPVPVLDEMLLSGGAAVAVYIWTAAKNRKSDLATKKRMELKNLVDASECRVDESLSSYEQLLNVYDEMPPLTLADKLTGNDETLDPVELPAQSEVVQAYLGLYLRQFDRYRKALDALDDSRMTGRQRERLSARLLTMSRNRKIDLPLIALFRSL